MAGVKRWCTRIAPWPAFAASSIETTSASQALYGRTIWPGNGLFVTVTIVPATLTVAVHPQNGSVTFVPEMAAVWYVATNEDVSWAGRTGPARRGGLTKIL